MKELKKYAAVGGAVALVACWPFATGKIGEAIFQDGIASYNKNGIVEIESVSYDRGYLSSTAQSRVYIVDPDIKSEFEQLDYPTELIVNHDISHGFLSVSSISTFDASSNQFDYLEGMVTTTESELTGKTTFTVTRKAADIVLPSLQKEGIEKLHIGDVNLNGVADKNGQASVSFDIPKIEVVFTNLSELLLEDMTLKNDGKYVDDIFIGSSSFHVGQIINEDAVNYSRTEIKGVNYSNENTVASEGTKENDTFNSKNRFSIAEVITNDGTLKNGVFDMSFEDLNYQALIKIIPLLQGQETAQDNLQQLMLSFDLLAAKGFKVKLNEVSAEIMDGKVESKLLLALPEGTARASENADKLVQTLTGDAELVIAKTLVDQQQELRMQVDELLINGFAVEEGDNYRLAAKIADGQIELLNGQKMPLFMLFGFLSYFQ